MNQGTQRIQCSRCRANNFLGQATCWQCGMSLPPPDAVGQPAYPPSGGSPSFASPTIVKGFAHSAQFSGQPAAKRSTVRPIIVALAVVIAALAILFLSGLLRGHSNRVATQEPDLQRRIDELRQQEEKLRSRQDPGVSDVNNIDPNSQEAQVKRQLKQMQDELRRRGVN